MTPYGCLTGVKRVPGFAGVPMRAACCGQGFVSYSFTFSCSYGWHPFNLTEYKLRAFQSVPGRNRCPLPVQVMPPRVLVLLIFLNLFSSYFYMFPLFSCGSDSPLKVSFRGGWGPGSPVSFGDLVLASQAAASHLCLVVFSALSLRCVWLRMCPSCI